jgi:hypothetical protein
MILPEQLIAASYDGLENEAVYLHANCRAAHKAGDAQFNASGAGHLQLNNVGPISARYSATSCFFRNSTRKSLNQIRDTYNY